MDTPTYNADGMQTWKPQPGEYYKYGLSQRESYGGIIAALNDVRAVNECGIPKSYPHNFAGIIAAIEDLAGCIAGQDLIDIGDKPPGWNIIINIDGTVDGDWSQLPPDGNLWFDTRQGRLFISIDGQYWQTNGGDGLAYVSDNVPQQQPVIGSTWYDTANDIMYVWCDDGFWHAVKGADDVGQTTATVPIAFKERLVDGNGSGNILPDDFPSQNEWSSILPPLNINQVNVQSDLNEWGLWADVELAKAVESANNVYVQQDEPTDSLKIGDLWFDTNKLELNIYSEINAKNQWVLTSDLYAHSERLETLTNALDQEKINRQNAITSLRDDLIARLENGAGEDEIARQRINNLEADVASIPRIDNSNIVRTADLNETKAKLQASIDRAVVQIPSSNYLQSLFASKDSIDELKTQVATLATSASVEQVRASIPSTGGLAKIADVTARISEVVAEVTDKLQQLLPVSGGRLTGGIVMDKTELTEPAIDFTTQAASGQKAFEFKTNAPRDEYAAFGTNDNWWEYAWNFESEEDFCWVFNEREKVFSITKDGPACSTLILGDFGSNTEHGRVIHNKIDVRNHLVAHQKAFKEMRQAVYDSTDYETLKSGILEALSHI